jgi:hypothetical protein
MKFGTQMKRIKVGPWNFFGAKKVPGGFRMPADFEQLERHTKLKLCRKLHTINVGSRNFIQLNVQLVEILFQISRKKSEISHFLWLAY